MLFKVAERQGKYLAKELNRILKAGGGQAGASGSLLEEGPPFVYRHLGSMASVGRYKALVDLRENKVTKCSQALMNSHSHMACTSLDTKKLMICTNLYDSLWHHK